MTPTILFIMASLWSSDTLPAEVKARTEAMAAASEQRGLGTAIGNALSAEAVVVFPGAPVVVGRDQIVALFAAQRPLDSLAATWTVLEGWTSKDGTMAIAVGPSKITQRFGGSEPRTGSFIAAWHREGSEWLLEGLMVSGVARPGETVVPLGMGPLERPAAPVAGWAREFIKADREFSDLAGAKGAPEAFKTFAAPNALMMGSGTEARRGPDAIAAGISGAADWRWYPVVGRATRAGDLGFTVGQAVIQPRSGGEPNLSKYLTVWTKLADGSVRFLTDGGNPRPKP